jgi:hypothetical protein
VEVLVLVLVEVLVLVLVEVLVLVDVLVLLLELVLVLPPAPVVVPESLEPQAIARPAIEVKPMR